MSSDSSPSTSVSEPPTMSTVSVLNSDGSFSRIEIDLKDPELNDYGRQECTVVKRLSANCTDRNSDDELIERGLNNNCNPQDDHNWRTHPIEMFTDRLSSNTTQPRPMSRKLRKFYQRQDALIHELEDLACYTLEANHNTQHRRSSSSSDTGRPSTMSPRSSKSTSRLSLLQISPSLIIRIVLITNVFLIVGKAVAAIISGSMSVYSALLDSCVDLASGGLMWYTSRAMRKRQPYRYPQGRNRLEPIAIIVLSVLMSTIAAQLLVESIHTIVKMTGGKGAPNVTDLVLGLMLSTVGSKLILWIICSFLSSGPSVRALKYDQRNDVFTNLASSIFCGLSSRLPQYDFLKFLDPIGAIPISIYIIYSWGKMALEQTRLLTGHAADPRFIQKVAFLCLNHHAAIERLDTIRAFHFGSRFLVEVDIVLPRGMTLGDAHDIGETLQKKLEHLSQVERAFVHLDYEYFHHPETEHKMG